MSQWIFLLVVPCALGLVSRPASAQAELELESLIREALANNPDLEMLRLRWRAEAARIPLVGALQDPLLKVEASNVPLSDFNFDSTPMSGKQLMISQKLPYWGKRADRERLAEYAAAAAEAAYLDREGGIVNKVKQAYFSLAFLDRSIASTTKNEALLEGFIHIARTKYAVGKGLQQDVLKAQVSRSSLKDRLIILQGQRRRAEARLNSALNRLPQAPVGRPQARGPTFFDYAVENLQKMALEHRPRLRGLRQAIQKWQVAEDLARRQNRPDFDISFGYRQRDFAADGVGGSDFFSLGVVVNLPIYPGGKQDQQVLEARFRKEAATAQYEAVKQQIFLQIQELYIDVQMHQEEAALFRTAIIPQADQSLVVAMTGYQVGKVDFLTLLDSQVKLFDFEIAYNHHRSERERALAGLEAVVGKRLF